MSLESLPKRVSGVQAGFNACGVYLSVQSDEKAMFRPKTCIAYDYII